MKARPLFAGKILPINIKADDIAVFRARCDRLGCARLETTAQIEMVRIVAPDCFGDRAKIGLGKEGTECAEIVDNHRFREHRR